MATCAKVLPSPLPIISLKLVGVSHLVKISLLDGPLARSIEIKLARLHAAYDNPWDISVSGLRVSRCITAN